MFFSALSSSTTAQKRFIPHFGVKDPISPGSAHTRRISIASLLNSDSEDEVCIYRPQTPPTSPPVEHTKEDSTQLLLDRLQQDKEKLEQTPLSAFYLPEEQEQLTLAQGRVDYMKGTLKRGNRGLIHDEQEAAKLLASKLDREANKRKRAELEKLEEDICLHDAAIILSHMQKRPRRHTV